MATSETMPVKLDAPGDSSADGCVIAVKEAVVKGEVETQLESTADFSGVEVNQNGHDVEDDEAPPPGFQCVAGEVTSADLDVERCWSLLRSCLCCRLGYIVSAVWKIWKSNYRV